MAEGDADRWDRRYLEQTSAIVASAPDALIDGGLEQVVPTAGRALDIACGLGAQSLWCAERGLDVEAVDVSGEAVRRVTATAADRGLGHRITATALDLDRGIPPEFGQFDVIVCQRFRSPELYPACVDRLHLGGIAIITVLSQSGADHPGPFHAGAGELAAAFEHVSVETLFHAAGNGLESIVLRSI
jgi:2-polyprenyl-3-methyl-5-hydroxy-6-metoxy-1,4-benzoquinol methylase